MMMFPEDTYETLALPPNVTPITDPNKLECSEHTATTGTTDGYVGSSLDRVGYVG